MAGELGRVLVVDDEESVRNLLQRVLKEAGYDVVTGANGQEAVDMARKHKPNLIFMDIMMPHMGGYDACSRIKNDKSTKGIPVVMLTALGYDLNKELAAETGADGYITKPFTSEDLLNTISKFLKTPE